MVLKKINRFCSGCMGWARVMLCALSLVCSSPERLWAKDLKNLRETPVHTHPVIQFYQTHISPIDGDRCPMTPTCSRYCADAIRKHGIGLGLIMTCDRLLRCGGDEIHQAPSVRIDGQRYTLDPVSANDFWWFSPGPSSPALPLSGNAQP